MLLRGLEKHGVMPDSSWLVSISISRLYISRGTAAHVPVVMEQDDERLPEDAPGLGH